MTVHDLKTWPEFFEAITSGAKTFELRRDDRNYAVGDLLVLREWNQESGDYTGRTFGVGVTYVLRGPEAVRFGLAPGFCVLGITARRGTFREASQRGTVEQISTTAAIVAGIAHPRASDPRFP